MSICTHARMAYLRQSTLVLALLLSVGVASQSYAQDVLVVAGQARGCIVIPEGTEGRILEGSASRVLKAAQDLADYLQAMSGARVPIRWDIDDCPGFRIMIGSTSLSPVDRAAVSQEQVGYDGFIIRSVPGGIVIAGRNGQGTVNGVYHFAEEVLGIHWYSAENSSPSIPRRRTVQIPYLDLTVKPDFAWRGQYYSIATKYLSDELKHPDEWWRFNRLWGIEAGCYHMFFVIVPNSLFAEHPEYFALIDGKRTQGDVNVQRCLSNPDVLQRAIEWTREQFERYPDMRFTTLSANDGGGWCECEACQAMGPTQAHRSLAFCNAVAEANEELYPTRGYVVLAYQGTLDPPLDMKAHHNVVPMLAFMGQCRTHPIDSDCPDCIYKREVLRGWQQVAGRLATYTYLNGGAFTGPGVITDAEYVRFARDCGSIGGFREHTAAPQANWAMLNWMEVKLMWDVDQDVVKLRRQFIEGYYGQAAADAVERVYEKMENSLRTSSIGPRPESYTYGHNHMSLDFLKPFVDACRDDIDTALQIAQTEGNKDYRRRIGRDMGALLGELPADLQGLLEE